MVSGTEMTKSTIDDLPDLVLVEILCRLFDRKQVFSCELVSKRWQTLLSDPCFIGRFLRLRRDHALVIEYSAKQNPSLLTISSSKFTSNFVSDCFSSFPCFRDHDPQVLGVSNDLALVRLLKHDDDYDDYYYVCNFYTKEWTPLPTCPPPGSKYVAIGFICEPYYSINEDNSTIRLNPEYRFRVVRLLADSEFNLEIYSSETDEWKLYRLSKALSQLRILRVDDILTPAVACSGKLYWYHRRGRFVFELDPFNISTTSTVSNGDHAIIDFIDAPELDMDNYDSYSRHIGVCRGRLRMCLNSIQSSSSFAVWELNENQEWDLIFSQVNLSDMVSMVSTDSFILENAKTWGYMYTVNFHPSDGDIVYFERDGYIVMCNLRDRTLETAIKLPGDSTRQISSSFPYVFRNREKKIPAPIWPFRLI